MKIFKFLFLLILFNSCQLNDEPKHLMSKNEVAEIIADLAIYEQAFIIDPQKSLETKEISHFVLKKYGISGKTLRESFAFHLKNPENIEEIYKKSQKIILEKAPKLSDLIKNNAHQQALSR